MSNVVAVTNTIAFIFPDNAAQPTLSEMVRFVKGLNGAKEQMDSAYKNGEERSVFIKYKTEQGMKEALSRNEVKQVFHYSNGKQAEVCMSVAGCNIQYVRVFDLPPEVPDSVLAAELKKFGNIKRCVREKFPPEFELDLFTGVRGIYMDVENEIPPVINFLNRRGRIFYRGSKLLCFACGQEGHLKKSCSKRKVTRSPTAAVEEEDGRNTFAAVLAGTSSSIRAMSSHKSAEIVEQEKEDPEEEKVEEAGKETETAAAANAGTALLDYNAEEADEEEGSIEIDESTTENFNMDAWQKVVTCIQDFKKAKVQQEAEKQRKQGKKSGAQAKTGASPPMKKKH